MSIRPTTSENPVYTPRTADPAQQPSTTRATQSSSQASTSSTQAGTRTTTADSYERATTTGGTTGGRAPVSTGSAAGDAAVKTVKALLEQGSPKAAAQALEKALLGLPQAVAAKVFEALRPSFGIAFARITNLNKQDTESTLVALAHAAKLAGPAATADLAKRLAAHTPSSNVEDWDDGITASIRAGAGPELALALVKELEAARKPQAAQQISNALVNGVDKLRESAKGSVEKLAELEARLAQDMAGFGAALKPEERARYEDAFWSLPANAKVRSDAERLTKDLSRAIQVAGPKLEAMARTGHENAGEVTLDTYELLAKVPAHAEQALLWAGKLGNDPALFGKIDGFVKDNLEQRLSNGLVADGTAALQQQLIQKYANDPNGQQKLIADTKRIFAGYKNAKSFASLGKQISSFLDNTERFANGSTPHAKKLLEGFAGQTRLGKALAVYGVASGLFKTGKAIANGDELAALKSALGTGKAGLELAAGVLGAYSGAAKLSGSAEFIGKFAPGLGLVLDAIQFGQDINELRKDPNAGEVVKAIGTLVQLGGDVAGYVPVLGTAVDGLLTVAGSVIHLVGDFVDGLIEGNAERDKLRAEQAALLKTATGLHIDRAKELVSTPASTYKRLTDLGLDVGMIRGLALSEVKLDSTEALTAITTAALFGLDAKETEAFVKRAVAGGEVGPAGTPLTEMYAALFNPARDASEGAQVWQRRDVSGVQARLLDQLSYRSPELAQWLKAHQGRVNWDVLNLANFTSEI